MVYGDKPFDSGIQTWKLKIDKYPSNDYSGIMFGVCEESVVGKLIGGSCLNNAKVHGMGGSGSKYYMDTKINWSSG